MTPRICVLVAVLSACASRDEVPKRAPVDVKKEVKPVAVEEVKAVATKEDPPAPTTAVVPDPTPPEPSEDDPFPLLRDEGFGALKLGMSVADLVAAVPAIKPKGKCISYEGTGESLRTMADKRAGVEVAASCEGKKNVAVESIRIKAPSKLESKRGIAIGDTAEEVKSAYGDSLDIDSPPSEESIVAGSIYGGLGFTLVKGRVTEMFLGAMAE